MTLEEIFQTKPELLQEPEVQKLIKYVKKEHLRSCNIIESFKGFYDKVLEKCMYSNVVLKDGKNADKTLSEIFDLLELP